MRIEDAIRLAQEADLDLVEVAPNSKPPVAKIMDFGKFKYETAQKAKEAKRNQTNTILKEVRFRLKIDTHDYETKRKRAEGFLQSGDKVKAMILFRGREQSRPEQGVRLLQRFAEDVSEFGSVESTPTIDGRNMVMVIGPLKTKAEVKAEHDSKKPARAPRPEREDAAPVAAPVASAAAAPAASAPAAAAPVAQKVAEKPVAEAPVAAAPVAAAPGRREARCSGRRRSPLPLPLRSRSPPPPRRRRPPPPRRRSRPPPRSPLLRRSRRPPRSPSPLPRPSRQHRRRRTRSAAVLENQGETMPKQKTHSGAKKRFKVTGSGKIMKQQAGMRHNLEVKSGQRKRRLNTDEQVAPANVKVLKRLLGKSAK